MKGPVLLIPRKLGTSPWTGPFQQVTGLGPGPCSGAVPARHLAQAAMAVVTSSGASSCGKWPMPGSSRHS
jgi:hypothetical protein